MKKNKKLYLTIGTVLIFLIAIGGGYYFYQQQKKSTSTDTAKTETNNSNQAQLQTDKTDNNPTPATTPIQVKPSTTTTTAPETLGTLSDVSLTAYMYSSSASAPDGSTTMPAGSIVPYFYAKSGAYTIQKMVGGAWKDIITNQSYPGHGGMAAWFDGPMEDNIQYRVLAVEGGKPVSTSKTFTVVRADLASGVHSYN